MKTEIETVTVTYCRDFTCSVCRKSEMGPKVTMVYHGGGLPGTSMLRFNARYSYPKGWNCVTAREDGLILYTCVSCIKQ